MHADNVGQSVGGFPAAPPRLATGGAGLLGFRRVDTVEPDAGAADSDGVAVDDLGDAD